MTRPTKYGFENLAEGEELYLSFATHAEEKSIRAYATIFSKNRGVQLSCRKQGFFIIVTRAKPVSGNKYRFGDIAIAKSRKYPCASRMVARNVALAAYQWARRSNSKVTVLCFDNAAHVMREA